MNETQEEWLKAGQAAITEAERQKRAVELNEEIKKGTLVLGKTDKIVGQKGSTIAGTKIKIGAR